MTLILYLAGSFVTALALIKLGIKNPHIFWAIAWPAVIALVVISAPVVLAAKLCGVNPNK